MKNSSEKMDYSLSTKSKFFFSIITFILVLTIIFITGEILLRNFDPQKYMYPRWEFSSEYGSMLYKNQNMTESRPGHFKFTSTINSYQYRGKLIPISNTYEKENIVILGDSYTFGAGVNGGEEYPAVMSKKLEKSFNIINLGVGGWGLTQQIRRYYEFGQLYSPKIVILMYCSNDPKDNLKNKVTIVDNGRFKFQDSNNNTINWIKKYLSHSIIQKSQLYNFFRARLYNFFEKRIVNEEIKKSTINSNIKDETPYKEKFYNNLLELFSNDLKEKGIDFIMISVPNQLTRFEHIKNKVIELNSQGIINYIETTSWFENLPNNLSLRSPEGHPGKDWHYIIGKNLSEIILNN